MLLYRVDGREARVIRRIPAWVRSPTYYQSANGLICIASASGDIFTIDPEASGELDFYSVRMPDSLEYDPEKKFRPIEFAG